MQAYRYVVCFLLAVSLAAGAAPLQVEGDRLYIETRVNGHLVTALLDSGAELTIIDDGFAAAIGLTPSGSADARGTGAGTVQARFAAGVTLQAAGLVLENRTVAILDLDDVGRRLLGRELPVILGRELFDAARLRIDIEGQSIEVVDPEGTPPGMALDLVFENGIESFPVSVEGRAPVLATFDLGNGSDMLVGRAYAEEIGLTAADRIVGRETGGGIGGAIERDIVIVKSLQVGGERFENVRVAIDSSEDAPDFNVGVRLLRRFTIVTDFAARKLWLRKRCQVYFPPNSPGYEDSLY